MLQVSRGAHAAGRTGDPFHETKTFERLLQSGFPGRHVPGCFRCHDGKHRSDDGAVLSRDCSLCHLLIERVRDAGAGGQDKASFQVMRNPHPVDIGNSWKEMLCHECHGASP